MRGMPGNVGDKIGLLLSGASWGRTLSPRNKWLDHPNIRTHWSGLGAGDIGDEGSSKADPGTLRYMVDYRESGGIWRHPCLCTGEVQDCM